MKILPINLSSKNFRADVDTKDPVTGDYKDPLMQWPLRGAAFTNEIGEGLRPIIGSYATLTWAPVFLYIGADIYDKYKNDKTEYSPSSRRFLKQAVFQGMASLLLPLLTIKLGQDFFSLFGYMTGDKISINTKEDINKLAEQFIKNGNMRAYEGKDGECISKFKDIIANNFDYHKKNNKKNYLKKALLFVEEKFAKKFVDKKQKNIENYAETTIISLIDLRKNLLNPSKEFAQTKQYKDYKMLLDYGQTSSVAVKNILTKSVKSGNIAGKIIKVIGGFFALAVTIHPIDEFVENVLIGKVIEPKLEKKKPA